MPWRRTAKIHVRRWTVALLIALARFDPAYVAARLLLSSSKTVMDVEPQTEWPLLPRLRNCVTQTPSRTRAPANAAVQH
jgi:hypothetical protein